MTANELHAATRRTSPVPRTCGPSLILLLHLTSLGYGQAPQVSAPQFERLQQLPPGAVAWPELKLASGRALRDDRQLFLVWEGDPPADRKVAVPRLCAPLLGAYWLGAAPDAPAPSLRPEVATWAIEWSMDSRPKAGSPHVLVLAFSAKPRLLDELDPALPGEQGTLLLPAHEARTHGDLLRYEPQPHKNTIGYWAKGTDWADWRLELKTPGEYSVEVLQGCGTGQGGSEVELRLIAEGAEQPVATARFNVLDTGHFQNFVRREIGTLRAERPGLYRLEVRPLKVAAKAVMDVREIRLVRK